MFTSPWQLQQQPGKEAMLNWSGSAATTLWTRLISCHKPDGAESGRAFSRHNKQLAETLLHLQLESKAVLLLGCRE